MPAASTRRRAGKKRVVKRRTQEERRLGTIRKLLHAATETLIEMGYADATVQRICARARLSQGALFRHFPTREALMVAVGASVGQALLDRYRREFESHSKREEPLALALRLVRDACRSRPNLAWYELAIAARTHEPLRKALEPTALRYYGDIEQLARRLLPDLAESLGDRFVALVGTIVAIFDGEVVHRFVVKDPRLEEARLELLTGWIGFLRPAP